MIHLHPPPSSLLFFFSFFILSTNPPPPSPLSHLSWGLQLQHLISISISGQPGGLKHRGGWGGYHPPYMCAVCAHVCVFVREPRRPQTFMCLLFIISNNFFPRLPRYLAPLLPAPCLPWCCVQLWALICFSVTHNYTPERAQLMSLSAIMARRCGTPFLDPLHQIQCNYYLLKISPALPPSLWSPFWLMHLSPDSDGPGYVLIRC